MPPRLQGPLTWTRNRHPQHIPDMKCVTFQKVKKDTNPQKKRRRSLTSSRWPRGGRWWSLICRQPFSPQLQVFHGSISADPSKCFSSSTGAGQRGKALHGFSTCLGLGTAKDQPQTGLPCSIPQQLDPQLSQGTLAKQVRTLRAALSWIP